MVIQYHILVGFKIVLIIIFIKLSVSDGDIRSCITLNYDCAASGIVALIYGGKVYSSTESIVNNKER